jgi:ElaB/YqjD/DUF883 family membrane-anchored ribosome-binding protein
MTAKSDIQVSREKLMADFNAVVADVEQLLKSVASEGGDKAQVLRAKAEESLKIAKARLFDIEGQLEQKAKEAAKLTEDYVQDHPWQTLGIAAAIGVLVGLLLNRR